jgi:hypothetical protein
MLVLKTGAKVVTFSTFTTLMTFSFREGGCFLSSLPVETLHFGSLDAVKSFALFDFGLARCLVFSFAVSGRVRIISFDFFEEARFLFFLYELTSLR